MKIDAHGITKIDGTINPLLTFLDSVDATQKWNYMGLIVEIDPTVDHNSQNMLIRWNDLAEGFNDRIIVNGLDEFNSSFSRIVNA